MPDEASTGRPRRRWRQRFLRATCAFVCLALLDAVAGWVLIRDGRFRGRPVPPYDLVFNPAQRDHLARMVKAPDPYTRFDPLLGWSIIPGGASADGLYRANAAGFRAGREYDPAPPPGVIRVAAFGDSYTHGAEVRNNEVWTQALESGRPDLEVLNFGVNGYGADQALLRFRRDGAKFNPDVVLIGYMIENITRHVNLYRPANAHETASVAVKPRFRLSTSGALEFIPCPAASLPELKSAVESGSLLATILRDDYWVARAPAAYTGSPLFISSLGRLIYGAYENAGRDPRGLYENVRSEPFQVTRALLTQFHHEAISSGAEHAVVLIFPDVGAVYDYIDTGSAYWSSLSDALQNAGVPAFDLTPTVAAGVAQFGLPRFFVGNHYSPLGNAVIAEAIHHDVLAPVLPP